MNMNMNMKTSISKNNLNNLTIYDIGKPSIENLCKGYIENIIREDFKKSFENLDKLVNQVYDNLSEKGGVKYKDKFTIEELKRLIELKKTLDVKQFEKMYDINYKNFQMDFEEISSKMKFVAILRRKKHNGLTKKIDMRQRYNSF